MNKNATKKALADLHARFADELKTILETGVTAADENGIAVKLTPGAPILNVIRQFLKDNGIDNPSVGEELETKKSNFPDLPFTSSDQWGAH